MFFSMAQIGVHGFLINIKFKSLYNPGMASTLLLFWSIALYYIHYIRAHQLVTTRDVVLALIVLVLSPPLTVLLPLKLMGSKSSSYSFEESEVFRFGKECLTVLYFAFRVVIPFDAVVIKIHPAK